MASLEEFVQSHINAALSQMYTSMPAKVVKVSKVENATTVDVQPLINKRRESGEVFEYPVLEEVIVQWPSGGGAYLTFPIKEGDLVELKFCMFSREELDYSDGSKTVSPAARRKHSLSDAVAVPSSGTYLSGVEAKDDAVVLNNSGTEIKVENSGKIVINPAPGSTIELGEGATEPVILGTTFATLWAAHTHPVSGSLAGPTTMTMVPGTHTSLQTVTK